MSKPFLLTPNLYNKLTGRGMELFCQSSHCIYSSGATTDKKWDNAIKPLGYGKCPRCKVKTDIMFFEHDEKKSLEMAHNSKISYRAKAKLIVPKCSHCGCIMGKKDIHYTQWVVSKHRKSNHYFYHQECYDAMFMAESGEDELFKKKKYKMRYAGNHGDGCAVYLPFDPRTGVCAGCGKSIAKKEIKLTSLHHWKYAYKAATVKQTPILILDNTSELCFACHQVADGLRSIMKMTDPERAVLVMRLLPKDLKDKFAIICTMYLKEYERWKT